MNLKKTLADYYEKRKKAKKEMKLEQGQSHKFVTHLKRLGIFFQNDEHVKKDP